MLFVECSEVDFDLGVKYYIFGNVFYVCYYLVWFY